MAKYEDVKLSPSDALDIYLKEYPNSIVNEIELEVKSNSYVYELEGYDDKKEYKIYISAADGSIIETNEKLLKGTYKEITKESTGKIQEVINKALKDSGENSEINEWSLKVDDGMLEFEIKLKLEDGKEVEYKYDLGKNELLKKD